MADAKAEILKLVQQMNQAKESGNTDEEDKAVSLFKAYVLATNKFHVCEPSTDLVDSSVIMTVMINLLGSFIGTHCEGPRALAKCLFEVQMALVNVARDFCESSRLWPPKFI